jgi:hypothetical protein
MEQNAEKDPLAYFPFHEIGSLTLPLSRPFANGRLYQQQH